MVKDRNHLNKLLLCIKQATHFYWKMMSNSGNSYGNYFDPARDCSSILDKIPDAKTGVYWIKTDNGPRKAWCDLVTDGGGFLLIGVQNSSRTMDVPSDSTLVHPLDLRHWSSSFGEEKILDFRVQIATSKSWSDTKAHWYYRFNTPRKLSKLLLFNDGNCDNIYPGVGDVKFVKDLQDNVVVTKKIECSRFDVHFHKSLGWGKMNECFRTPCKTGFNHLKLATSGAFSFSVESSKSGIINNSTKYIGCEKNKCCVCYGPSSDKDYCAPGCKAINGGTVLTDDDTEIHAWYWIRTSLPKRVWKKCMEYEKIEGGKTVKWHVDEHNKVPQQGPCSYPGDVRFNDGVAVVDNKETLEKLPNIEGLLSYRTDNKDLLLRGKHSWNRMAKENQILKLEAVLGTSQRKLEKVQTSQNELRKELTESKPKISDVSSKVLKLEAELGTSQRKLEKVKTSQNELRKEKTESKAKISDLSSKLLKLEAKLGTSKRKLRKDLTESKAKISDLSSKLLKLEEENKIYSSCKSALEKIGNAKHGVYKIKSLSVAYGYSNVYCHMTSMPGCSGGGWTLVMKINGKKETFHYGSSYWNNKATYNPGGLTGFDDVETKQATYWNTPFKEICLGMKVNNNLNFISISYQASSLYNVIADGSYRSTSIPVGRSKWLSLVRGSALQSDCNREGFNVHPPPHPRFTNLQAVRIGILGNEGDDGCKSPDSYLGFGGIAKNKRGYCGMPKTSNTCGNAGYCILAGANKEIPAMGYIFVR
ncbi:Hypothetical predicted protein [Paramuricea clavata]|uniref:Uncharacterized protein n=1 Tax=Paramuricea clavata TaxID=317549 RepID=A0A7D9HRJ8_PARCT|nr:Hypothetical predicted protein [Paramuricea clavata]